MFLHRLKTAVILAVALAHSTSVAALDDLPVYTDGALASGWENWSWSSTIDFAATDLFEGTSSIAVTSEAWAAVSVKLEGTFPTHAGLKFDIAGANPDIQVYFDSTVDSVTSATIPLSAFGQTITNSKFTTLLVDFKSVPGTGAPLGNATWDRISFQAGGSGATYHLDNIVLVSSIFVAPTFVSAEPIGSNVIAVTTTGTPDFSKVNVTLNNKVVKVSKSVSYSPPDTPGKSITYLNLATNLAAGPLSIATPNGTFSYTLPKVSVGSVTTAGAYPINPYVYGVNFPTSASYIKNLGVTLSRWGGNAVTAYNPFGGFTNAGNDWYFENRASDSADDWVGWVKAAGSDALLTVPALDWVSKDATSYSYPKSVYADQAKFDPYNADAGNGQYANGSWVQPVPNPSNVYTAWNTTAAKTWLTGLKNKPKIVAIDNEIEIAHSTHQDMHSEPMSYDEELKRVVDFATAAKSALPNVLVAAPSTCAWWFYWTSAVGYTDNAAHSNIDFLPWFLQQMKAQEAKVGRRLLDYLDIHYYFAADTSSNNATAKAIRLRQSRSLWDPTYVDESWIGTNEPQNHQPNPTKVQLIPRFRSLIDSLYPGTKLSISEWSSTNDNDITGGLLTADALGIFGKYKVDAATYWATPNEQGPVGLAYWLYRGNGVYFGSNSAQVIVANSTPDKLGIYAGVQSGKLTFVIINKDPASPVSFTLSNVPSGTYFVRHFGGASGVAKWQTTMTITPSQYIVVPSYTAVFLQQK